MACRFGLPTTIASGWSATLLLYTDGVIETQNAAGEEGEEFGYQQLERVVRDNRLQPASELQTWRPAGVDQQDDITLVVVDVL